MVRLREIPRTAAFTWSSGVDSPWIATGTKSGAVDIDFSNETCLELWDLALDDSKQGQELKPAVAVPTETGFHDLAWSQPNDDHKQGIVAGALDNGTLGMWDVERTLANGSNGLISDQKIHSGAIKALQFNPKISNLLATGGAKGELFISDLHHADTPVRLGSTAARADDIECLDWNKKVSHIMVTGSSGGFVTVWDMKTKKESLTLNNSGRKAVSAVVWDPEKPTRLITAVPLEQEPVILVWDLRNSQAPEKTLRGHDSGVLSLSWCPQDSDLLLSCGKDNRTILWNPQSGEMYGDYPVVTNWTFQTRWNPHNPSIFATASFDGKLQVQSLQNTNPSGDQVADLGQAGDGEDFFSKAQTRPQTSSFSLSKAPKWLERPVSASFGFGGRLITVRPSEPGKSRLSKIDISKFEVDSSVGSATDNFDKALQAGDLDSVCQSRMADAKSDADKVDWEVMSKLVSQNPREGLVSYLGFGEAGEAADGIAQLGLDDDTEVTSKLQVNGTRQGHKRLSSIFDNTPDGDFLSELAASKGTTTNNPFQIYTGSESEADRRITRALMLGQFEKALDVCLQQNRMSDAFMIAICGGEACTKKAQEAYFAKQSGGPNYLRLLASVVGKNLWDVVHNADLANWKEVMATMCTFADEKEFPDLCEALGDRLEDQDSSPTGPRKDASFCFMAGSKLEKVVSIWIHELKESEEAGVAGQVDGSAFSLHARGLQDFIEKVTVFRKVVNYRDTELSKTADWKLSALYGKYLEYAEIVSAHGQLAVAQKYLDLLPTNYPEADVARTRIQQATKKAAPVASQAAAARSKTQRPLNSYQQPEPMFNTVAPERSTSYGNSASSLQSSSQYTPQMQTQTTNPYAAATVGYQSQPQMRAPPPTYGYGTPQHNPIAPPPRSYNQSPSIPPPSQASNMSNWNDLPEGFVKPPTSRRGTPSVPVVGSPFPPTAAVGPPPPVAPPFGARQRATPPIAPPPKGSAPPPRVTSPLVGDSQSSYQQRQTSAASSAYAPPPSAGPAVGQSVASPPIPHAPSPYNAPPANAPPPNRYAPAPGSESQSRAPSSRPSVAPPPQQSAFQPSAPPPNPYAIRPPSSSTQNSYAPPPPQQQPYSQPPPPLMQHTGPLPSSALPSSASPPGTADSQPNPAPAPARRHPKGDRTHIPASSEPIFTILSSEMARVKARAPASFRPQVVDTEKRLDILFDHLNNEDLLQPDTIAQMVELSEALQRRDFARAGELQVEIHRDKVDESGNWMVGVKRLVGMCRATPL